MKEIDITVEGIYKEDEKITKCREKAMLYLSYGDHTVRSMHEKLIGAGFDDETVNEVLAYLVDRKYINEAEYLERFIKHAAYKKKYGKKKIELLAYEKGFSKSVIKEFSSDIYSDIDFAYICSERLLKEKADGFADKKSRDKIIAKMLRCGFSFSEIKEAIALLGSREQ